MEHKMTKPEPPEIIIVDAGTSSVSCDGGGALGHPRVYYSFDGRNSVECLYCDRLFAIKGSAADPGADKKKKAS